jgi:hypothetical protein
MRTGSAPAADSIVETGREIATRVVDVAEPRLEVLFQGSGTYRQFSTNLRCRLKISALPPTTASS